MQGRRIWAHAAFLVAALSAGLVAGPSIVNAASRGSGASPEVIAATSQGVLASGNRTNVVLAACDEIGGVVLESGGTTLYMFQPDGTIVWQGTVNGSINNHLADMFNPPLQFDTIVTLHPIGGEARWIVYGNPSTC